MHWLVGRVGSSGAYLQALEYAYDAAGNVVRIVDAVSAGGVQTQTFGYDGMDRLTSAAATGGGGGTYSESYSYDSAGRLVNGPRGGGYVYGDAAHKRAVTAVSGGHSYAYDANGNLVSRTSGGQTLSFVYDAENRLVGVSGAASAAFVYDGDGRRVKGTVNGVTTYYVGDYYEVSAGVVKKYYSAGGQRIALREGGTLYWLLTDHLGGTAYIVSGTTKTGELRYRPFGVTRFASGTTPTTYRFTGQREEAALGLYDYHARWYDPALGHFLSPDSIVPEPGNALDYHRYAYVRFNPLKYSDPSGHCPKPPAEYANAICVAGFIPTSKSEGFPGGLILYEGDDRNFSSDSTGQSSRFYFWIDAETGQFIGDPKKNVHPTIQLFPSQPWLGGGEHQPRHAHNQFTIKQFDDGTIYVTYSVVCAGPGCLFAPGPEGELYFIPNEKDSFDVAGSVERFPNLEGYHWRNGNFDGTLFQLQNFSQEELSNDLARFSTGMNMYDWMGREAFFIRNRNEPQ